MRFDTEITTEEDGTQTTRYVSALEPGDIVGCPQCGADVLRVIEKPQMATTDYTKCFEPIQLIGQGSRTRCTRCNALWAGRMQDGEIHEGGLSRIYIKHKGWVI